MDSMGREWLSFIDSAEYLKEKTNDKWIEPEVLRAILDGRLALVVEFTPGTSFHSESEAENEILPSAEQFEKHYGTPVEGLWVVPLDGNGYAQQYIAYLERGHYEKTIFSDFVVPKISQPHVMLHQGTFVTKLRVDAALAEPFGDQPRSSRPVPNRAQRSKQKSIFPPGTRLGVRISDLDAFIKKLKEELIVPEPDSAPAY